MKTIRLSLAAVLAIGAFSTASALPLEEAIQDIDIGGMLRYRYQSDRLEKSENGVDSALLVDGYNQSTDQTHEYKIELMFKAALADNLQVRSQIDATGNDGGFQNRTDTGVYGYGVSQRATTPELKYLDIVYSDPNTSTQIIAGRTKVASIWTDDVSASGLVISNNALENINFTAYVFDNFSYDDMVFLGPNEPLVTGNLYGGAMIANFEPVSLQLWAAYNNNLATLYAVDAAYNANIDDANFGLHAQYIGNKLQGAVKNKYSATNGQFMALKLSGDVAGFDANAGLYMYGDEDKFSASIVEDLGQTINAGQSLIYSMNGKSGSLVGSKLTGSIGKNQFFFLGAGYTIDKLRLGIDGILGSTKYKEAGLAQNNSVNIDKQEVVASFNYAYTPRVSVSGFISYYTEKDDLAVHVDDNDGKFMRLEGAYYF